MNACAIAAETSVKKIEDTFKDFTNRDDIAIILINQHIANMIRHMIDNYIQARSHNMPSGVTFLDLQVHTKYPIYTMMAVAQLSGSIVCAQPIPAILEIPSKEHPYDPAKDSILSRVKIMFGGDA